MRLAPSILLLAILACGTLASCNGGADTNPYYDPNWRDKQHPADTTGGGNDDPNPGIEGLGDKTVIPEGALYNGIVLPAIWPPRTYTPSSVKPMDCPYLSTDHPAVVRISVGRQLFFDNFLISSTSLQRTFHKPVKYSGNPILSATTSLERPSGAFAGAGPKDGGIWWDPQVGKFKMWYEAGWLSSMAYATSTNGLNWDRPNLYDGTNQLASLKDLHPNSCAVVLDYAPTDGFRYKMFFREPNSYVSDMHGVSMVSTDGITWTKRTTTAACGDRSTMFYNPFRQKWIYSLRNCGKLGSSSYGRTRYYTEADDFLAGASWKPGNTSSVVFWCRADEKDKMDADVLASMGPGANEAPELYNLNAVAYESIMLGFHQILVDENEYAQAAGRPKVTDLYYSFSRDGFHWDRPYREAAIPSTRTDGSWDRGYVQCVGGLCSVMADHIVFWYIGFAGDSSRPGASASMHSNMATGAAILRRDGFAGMRGSGQLTTVPVTFDGKYLFVNADCGSGSLKTEVLYSNGEVIPGFEKEKCVALKEDSTIAQISWEGVNDLSALAGYTVRFRFILENGELFSFWVSPSDKGESMGYVAGGGPGYSSNIDTMGKTAYTTASTIYPFNN